MNKNVMLIVSVLAVVVLVGGGVWYMSKKNVAPTTSTSTPTETTTDTTTVIEETPVEATGEVKKFTVEGSGFKFVPNTIKVNKGDTVQITFKNLEGNHDLVIDEFDVKTNIIGPEEEEEVEFVASKAGTFDYYCSVSNHRAMGMVGQLTVE